jgi:hypothetical protein
MTARSVPRSRLRPRTRRQVQSAPDQRASDPDAACNPNANVTRSSRQIRRRLRETSGGGRGHGPGHRKSGRLACVMHPAVRTLNPSRMGNSPASRTHHCDARKGHASRAWAFRSSGTRGEGRSRSDCCDRRVHTRCTRSCPDHRYPHQSRGAPQQECVRVCEHRADRYR